MSQTHCWLNRYLKKNRKTHQLRPQSIYKENVSWLYYIQHHFWKPLDEPFLNKYQTDYRIGGNMSTSIFNNLNLNDIYIHDTVLENIWLHKAYQFRLLIHSNHYSLSISYYLRYCLEILYWNAITHITIQARMVHWNTCFIRRFG